MCSTGLYPFLALEKSYILLFISVFNEKVTNVTMLLWLLANFDCKLRTEVEYRCFLKKEFSYFVSIGK